MTNTAPGFAAVLGSEWRKLWTLRSTYVVLGLAIVLSYGLTALLCTVIGANWESIAPAERSTMEPTQLSLAGALCADILLIVLAVTVMSSEYSTGMIRLTLTTTPRRGRVLAAKLAMLTTVALGVGFVVTFGGFLLGQAIFASYDMATARLGDEAVLRAVLLSTLATPAVPLLGAGLAVVFRNAAGAIATILGVLFAPVVVGGMLPTWWQENVLRYFPGVLSESVATVTPSQAVASYLEPGPASVALVGWVLLAVVVAHTVLTRRDA